MILVGTFNEQQLINKVDKKAVEEMRKQYPDHKYTASKILKGDKLRVWIATLDEYINTPWM